MTRPRPLRLLQITDPHLYGDESRSIYGVNTAVSLHKVLQEAMGEGALPDAVLATGDIADDHSSEGYRNFRRALEGFGVPVFVLPGNHDEPTLMSREFDGAAFQYCGSADFGTWGAVFLDTHLPGSPAGNLSAAELARLESELRRFRGRPALVCLHHPPVAVGSAWLDGLGLRNASEFLEVIDGFPDVRLTLAGHVHQAFDQMRGTVRMLATPSTCAQFTPALDSCLMDMRPPGYRWLHLQADGTAGTEVMWLQDWVMLERPRDDRF
jgi:Icc protein